MVTFCTCIYPMHGACQRAGAHWNHPPSVLGRTCGACTCASCMACGGVCMVSMGTHHEEVTP